MSLFLTAWLRRRWWTELAWTLTGVPLTLPCVLCVALGLAAGLVSAPVFVGVLLIAGTLLLTRRPGRAVLLFSQYVETRYAADLLADRAGGVGYLLKDRVAEVSDFLDALHRVADGETVLDPEVVSQLFGSTRQTDALATLTPREREVLGLMAEGRSNAAIAATLFLSAGSVEKNVTNIFGKLGLPPSEGDNRRVLAVLRYLES
ncbi:DNA-binding response regulator [Amycolatopsis nigrescens]|uniref:response regulator transcription factor n=1 Tax=Amycolatopsis nigrescens TaxID=381445 RepID=UPI00039B9005|nr:response regulator transcription factor [Amycolatopsis nigrescens]